MNVIREIDGARNSNRERKYIYQDIKTPDNIAVINLCLSTNQLLRHRKNILISECTNIKTFAIDLSVL